MVGHLLEYHPGVVKLKEIADAGELGDIHYIYGNRLNLGQLRADENALWSLGAHDVSVVLALVGEEPSEVSAFGESYMQPGIEDVVFGFLRFPSGVAAHLHLSWLDPHKERRFTVVGSKRMATFDDMSLERKIEIYDKGFDQDFSSYGEYIARSGDIHSPRISNEEPLRIECRHFIECIAEGLRAALRRRRAACAWCACSRRCRSPSPRRAVLRPSDRAPGLLLGDGVELPDDAQLGAYVVVHDGTVLGRGLHAPGPRRGRQAAGARAALDRVARAAAARHASARARPWPPERS